MAIPAWGHGHERPGRQRSFGPLGATVFVDHVGPDCISSAACRASTASATSRPTGSTWWAPMACSWWITVLFATGSLMLAFASIDLRHPSSRSPRVVR
jgi:hypothetical protein